MHGGAHGSGAPAGNHNARTHGEYSAAAVVQRQAARALLDYLRRGVPVAPGVDVDGLRARARRGGSGDTP